MNKYTMNKYTKNKYTMNKYTKNKYTMNKYTMNKLCTKLALFTRLYRDTQSTKHKILTVSIR